MIEPFYTNYNTFCFESGIILKAVHTDIESGFKVPPIEEFEKLVTPRTKAILISNPGNPTGTLYSKEDMLALGEVARKHNLFLISDEVYREFSYTDEPRFSAMNIPGLADNVILVDSVSKRYNLCGCRVGCIVSPQQGGDGSGDEICPVPPLPAGLRPARLDRSARHPAILFHGSEE